MDEKYLERAEIFATCLIENGINRARKAVTMPIGFDGHCSCGEVIPSVRISYGFYNCVDCQTAIERGGQLLRK